MSNEILCVKMEELFNIEYDLSDAKNYISRYNPAKVEIIGELKQSVLWLLRMDLVVHMHILLWSFVYFQHLLLGIYQNIGFLVVMKLNLILLIQLVLHRNKQPTKCN